MPAVKARSRRVLSAEILSLQAFVIFLATALIYGVPAKAQDQAGRLTVELNKFEDDPGGSCRAFFLFRNKTGLTLEGFEMSLAILNTGGVIDRLLTIDAAPIPVARTTLKLFEIPQTRCDSISEVLLHEIGSCRPQNSDEIDCFPLLDLTSRTSAPLVQ